jgi:hypothetical protein
VTNAGACLRGYGNYRTETGQKRLRRAANQIIHIAPVVAVVPICGAAG